MLRHQLFACSLAMFAFQSLACSGDTTTRPGAGGDNQAGAAGSSSSGGNAGAGGATGAGTGGASSTGGNSNGGGVGTGGAGGGALGDGAAGSTAGSTGSGERDAATSDAAAVVPVLADNFEAATANGPPDPTKWTVDLMFGQGTVSIDGTIGHNSAKSLHVNSNNAFHTMAMAQGAPLFPAPGNRFFGRVYLRLGAAMPSGHVIWIEAGSVMNDVVETRIGSNLSQLDINKFPGDTEQRAPAAKIAATTWTCVEFMFDGGGSEARVWLDSVELTDLHVTNWVAPVQANGNNTTPILNWGPQYDAVRIGWELGGGEIWFDDVAFGYSRLGCL
jgi:hypothetical protein